MENFGALGSPGPAAEGTAPAPRRDALGAYDPTAHSYSRMSRVPSLLQELHCWDAFCKCYLTGRTITSGDVAAAAHLSGHTICGEVGLCMVRGCKCLESRSAAS